jgi:hypothetical protein
MEDAVKGYKDVFLGYGNAAGRICFLGPEERGTLGQMRQRANAWDALGRGTILDLRRFHAQLPPDLRPAALAPEGRESQRTWNWMADMLLGGGATLEQKKEFVKNRLGSGSGDHFMMEISPVPRKRMSGSTSVKQGDLAARNENLKKALSIESLKLTIVYSAEAGKRFRQMAGLPVD